MKFLNKPDINKNDILNIVVHKASVMPESPVEGQIYHNTTDHKIYVYNGTSWVEMCKPGDMTKAVYDTDGNNIVDKAEKVDDGTYSATAQNLKDAVDKKHEKDKDQYLDYGGANQVSASQAKSAYSQSHAHSNKALLDTYDQTNANLSDAVTKKHSQGTDTTLGSMTADINMNSHQLTNLSAPNATNKALRQTVKITEAMLEKTLYIVENAQTGTTYTLVIGDDHKLITCSNSSAITLTVPNNTSVAFTVGTQILVMQKGTGTVTISGASGVTINSPNNAKKTITQYSMAGLIKLGTNTWALFGDLE